METNTATIQPLLTLSACKKVAKDVDGQSFATHKNVALLSNFTLQGLDDCLIAHASQFGIGLSVYTGEYGQWQQEILGTELYASQPDVIFLILDLWGIDTDVWATWPTLLAQEREQKKTEVLQRLQSAITALTEQTDTKIVLAINASPAWSTESLEASTSEDSLVRTIADIETALTESFSGNTQIIFYDFESFLGRIGKEQYWYTKYLYLGDMRLSPEGLPLLAQDLMHVLVPLSGKTKKCIVLDLDDTLWGGVIGEDGLSGIALAPTGAGQQFYHFQQALLGLRSKGFILAINSKNNPEDVDAVFAEHPYMVLTKDHFASIQTNWDDKASNMHRIAAELNISTDSFLFVDNDPTNRALIRQALPEIGVLELPEDSTEYTKILLRSPWLSTLSITADDTKRAERYTEEKKRNEFQAKAIDMDSFLQGLGIELTIAKLTGTLLPRAAQLTQKTNQFNLTTRRYQEEDIRSLQEKGAHIWTIDVADTFGTHGVTGLAIVQDENDTWKIDTFLLSCRVLGKRIEEQFLAYILEQLKQLSAKDVIGERIATAKNAQTEDFYDRVGFVKESETIWKKDLRDYDFAPIGYIAIQDH